MSTEVFPVSLLRHWHVIIDATGDPCSEADLSFGQEREIDRTERADVSSLSSERVSGVGTGSPWSSFHMIKVPTQL